MGSTSDERQRAYARFEDISNVHIAAIEAFRILATIPDATDVVGVSIQMKLGMTRDYSADQVHAVATSMLETVEQESKRGYQVIRSSALIAVCGAFEHLLKATFVDQAAFDPEKAASLLTKAKIRLAASEVLGTSPAEQWFSIADRLFEQLSEGQPHMYDRVQRFLVEYTYLPARDSQLPELRGTIAAVDSRRFNEAFLVRNCLVHNGGRVSTQLARIIKQPIGKAIVFEKRYLASLLKPIRALATHLNSLCLVL